MKSQGRKSSFICNKQSGAHYIIYLSFIYLSTTLLLLLLLLLFYFLTEILAVKSTFLCSLLCSWYNHVYYS